jgi:hypothetical protein
VLSWWVPCNGAQPDVFLNNHPRLEGLVLESFVIVTETWETTFKVPCKAMPMLTYLRPTCVLPASVLSLPVFQFHKAKRGGQPFPALETTITRNSTRL